MKKIKGYRWLITDLASNEVVHNIIGADIEKCSCEVHTQNHVDSTACAVLGSWCCSHLEGFRVVKDHIVITCSADMCSGK